MTLSKTRMQQRGICLGNDKSESCKNDSDCTAGKSTTNGYTNGTCDTVAGYCFIEAWLYIFILQFFFYNFIIFLFTFLYFYLFIIYFIFYYFFLFRCPPENDTVTFQPDGIENFTSKSKKKKNHFSN